MRSCQFPLPTPEVVGDITQLVIRFGVAQPDPGCHHAKEMALVLKCIFRTHQHCVEIVKYQRFIVGVARQETAMFSKSLGQGMNKGIFRQYECLCSARSGLPGAILSIQSYLECFTRKRVFSPSLVIFAAPSADALLGSDKG